MNKSTLAGLLTMAVAGIVAFGTSAGWFRLAEPMATSADPLIKYPAKLDLGDRELGELAIMPFTIANRGSAELIIDRIETNCSCTGMERREGGRFVRLDSLKIKGGEEARVVMRVSVRGVPPGTAMHNSVGFRTNDPQHREGRIEAIVRRVRAGVYATPQSVAFQTVPVGTQVCQILDVRDTDIQPRSIVRVSSTDPDRVTVRLLPVAMGPQQPDRDHGTVIGQLRVVVNTDTPGSVSAAIQIHLAGEARQPDEIRVLGTVVAPIEISPSSLFLPRQSADGPVYSATCLCRSTNGEPVALEVVAVPPDLTVELVGQDEAPMRLFRVTWNPDRCAASAGPQRRLVRFKARDGEQESALELPVTLAK